MMIVWDLQKNILTKFGEIMIKVRGYGNLAPKMGMRYLVPP